MTTATVQLNVTGNATQQLARIQKQVDGLGKSFSSLRNILSGIALAGFVTNTLRLADSMDDLSKATGFSIATIDSFSKALQANGGDAQDVNTIFTRFAKTLDDARTKGGEAFLAFQKLGLGVDDLKKSDEEVFKNVMAAFAELPASAERTALSLEMISKNANTIDFKGLIKDQKEFYKESKKNEGSIKSSAELFNKFNTTLNRLRDALMVSLKPLVDYLNGIPQEKINQMVDSFTKMAVAIAGLATAAKVISAIGSAFLAIRGYILLVKEGAAGVALTMAILGKQWGWFSKAFKAASGAWAKLGEVLIFIWTLVTKRLKFLLIGLGTLSAGITALLLVLYGLREAIKLVFDVDIFAPFITAWDFVIGKAKEYLGILDNIDKFEGKGGEFAGGKGATGSWTEEGDMAPDVDPLKDFRDAVNDITEAFQKNREASNAALASEVAFAMMATDTADQIRAQQKAYDDITNAIDDLQKKKQSLKPEQLEEIKIVDEQIAALTRLIPVVVEEARVRVEALQNVKNAQDEVVKQTELMKQQLTDDAAIKALQDQIALIQLYGDELENANIALEVTQSLEQALLELRKQELDLIARKGQLTDEQFQREMAQIEALRQAAYKKAGNEIDAKTKVQEAQRIADEDASLGVKKYIDELEKSTTPAKQALESVQSVFNNMDDALTTFVRTGKFKFKDFALSVIQDLLLIQAKAAMVAVFKGILKGLGIFGFAEGGNVKGGMPIIVGEKGPELFVPPSSGKIVPNNQLGGATSGNGGGGGPVTNNFITNNINAVDAKSVAQLFAENRRTLLGSVKMAEREMPYMAR